MADKLNTEGRKANDAQPLGERDGLVSDKSTKKTGKDETTTAGPDGGDARETTEGVAP